MRNSILRTWINAILFSLSSGIVILSICLMLGWKTVAQFRKRFLWVGFLLTTIVLISYQGYSQPAFDWPLIRLGPVPHANLYLVDTLNSNTILVFLWIAGLLLFGLPILPQSLF